MVACVQFRVTLWNWFQNGSGESFFPSSFCLPLLIVIPPLLHLCDSPEQAAPSEDDPCDIESFRTIKVYNETHMFLSVNNRFCYCGILQYIINETAEFCSMSLTSEKSLFQCIVSAPYILPTFLCVNVKRGIIYKGDGLRLIIYVSYSSEMASDFILEESVDKK
jgi:hypothetical protein